MTLHALLVRCMRYEMLHTCAAVCTVYLLQDSVSTKNCQSGLNAAKAKLAVSYDPEVHEYTWARVISKPHGVTAYAV